MWRSFKFSVHPQQEPSWVLLEEDKRTLVSVLQRREGCSSFHSGWVTGSEWMFTELISPSSIYHESSGHSHKMLFQPHEYTFYFKTMNKNTQRNKQLGTIHDPQSSLSLPLTKRGNLLKIMMLSTSGDDWHQLTGKKKKEHASKSWKPLYATWWDGSINRIEINLFLVWTIDCFL